MEKFEIGKLNNKELEKSYNDALKNEDFKNYVNKIKLPATTLMKYTSILESSCVEYTNCKKCKNILECKNKVCGYAYLPKIQEDELVFSYKPCKYKEKMENETKHLKNIYMLGVNNYITDACIENIYKEDKNRHETIKWILNFLKTYEKDKNQKGLYLSGSFGCGKTYLISALFNELAKKGFKSSIIFWPEFLRDLKASFDFDFREGATWTTDAFYRETRDKVDYYKNKGCVCVEMEASSIAAVCEYKKLDYFTFYYAGDNLDSIEWEKRSLHGEDMLDKKSEVALLALELAKRIKTVD